MLLVNFGGPRALAEWQGLFAQFAPDLEVKGWDDPQVDPERVRYALVWQPAAGWLGQFPHLKLVLSQAAGIDHILADPSLPSHLPIVRMVTDETAERMADFVTMGSYALVRQLPAILEAQRQQRWDTTLTGRKASETTVGILGLGQLGTAVAERLRVNGFQVAGWSRSAKQIEGVQGFVGNEQLDAFLAKTDILVNLLPDTPQTRGLIDTRVLSMLPRGAGFINAGRGTHVVTDALLAALDAGHLSGAMLDVFACEPLLPGDPLWSHPGVIVSGHVASAVSRRSKAQHVAASIAADLAGEPVAHLYDRVRGY
ncbi:putative dehydrogenase [Pseudomonas syringae pv. aceris]|uniref:2-hydroxyacid dehydrogenase n=1 Tax=Pseudomonas syringae TaxID=317 RepID=UPI0006BF4BAE|nr:glyoxylate/hydroxypyruvate reductase A [Pseudomonas syringae]KOG03508.1 putative dehydrogenase [Pseudomonas syringae pv. aceris]